MQPGRRQWGRRRRPGVHEMPTVRACGRGAPGRAPPRGRNGGRRRARVARRARVPPAAGAPTNSGSNCQRGRHAEPPEAARAREGLPPRPRTLAGRGARARSARRAPLDADCTAGKCRLLAGAGPARREGARAVGWRYRVPRKGGSRSSGRLLPACLSQRAFGAEAGCGSGNGNAKKVGAEPAGGRARKKRGGAREGPPC